MSLRTCVSSWRALSKVQPWLCRLAISFQSFSCRHAGARGGYNVAQAGVGGRGGGGIVEGLLVEILQAGKVGSAAQGDSVAEHGLRAREPGGREVHAGDRNLGRLV